MNPHSNGVKCELIETEYKILYQQILPLDWLDIIKNRSLLSVEELVGGNIAVYPIEVIRHVIMCTDGKEKKIVSSNLFRFRESA